MQRLLQVVASKNAAAPEADPQAQMMPTAKASNAINKDEQAREKAQSVASPA